MFKDSFCLFCSSFIYLPVSIHEGDGIEAAVPATSPAELYCFCSHILNLDGHWHCKAKKRHAAESSSFHFCNSTHLTLKQKIYKLNPYKSL